MRNWITLAEAVQPRFYHGSREPLDIGTMLHARPDGYVNGSGFDEHERESHNRCEAIIERYRPREAPPRAECVFMVLRPDEIDYAGGYDDYVYVVQPTSPVWRANLTWYSDLYIMCEDPDALAEDEAAVLAHRYWAAEPKNVTDLFEYLTREAVVVRYAGA